VKITEQLNKHKFISKIVMVFTQSFFFIIRKVIKLNEIKDGNIVIISLLKLGDSVFTVPAIKEIQNHYQKKIIIICFPESVPIFKLALAGVSFSPIEHEEFFFNERMASSKARKILKSSNPEIIFDFNGVMTSATLIFSSQAKTIVGIGRRQFKTIYDFFVPENRNNHLMDIYLETIAPLIPIIDKEIIKQFLRTTEKNKNILIHPFAGWNAKEWNLAKYIQLGSLLSEKYDVSIVAPINSIESDIKKEIIEKGMSFTITQTVDDLISEIKKCSIFIGNDSGPIHIADLLGKFTFCIYGPTNPKFPRPIGNQHSYCKSEIKCTPKNNEEFCFTNGGRNGCPAYECMNSLTVEKVYSELSGFLNEGSKKLKY
jgi:ADP-heptose:LPS heptosyltransferase